MTAAPNTEGKRPTLASLSGGLADLARQVEDLGAGLRRVTVPPDVETTVAGKCARALDDLERSARGQAPLNNYSNNYLSGGSVVSYHYQPLYAAPTGPVPRVIDYLRQRYGLPDPSAEAQRLSAELQRAYGRIGDLEERLQKISGAVSS